MEGSVAFLLLLSISFVIIAWLSPMFAILVAIVSSSVYLGVYYWKSFGQAACWRKLWILSCIGFATGGSIFLMVVLLASGSGIMVVHSKWFYACIAIQFCLAVSGLCIAATNRLNENIYLV